MQLENVKSHLIDCRSKSLQNNWHKSNISFKRYKINRRSMRSMLERKVMSDWKLLRSFSLQRMLVSVFKNETASIIILIISTMHWMFLKIVSKNIRDSFSKRQSVWKSLQWKTLDQFRIEKFLFQNVQGKTGLQFLSKVFKFTDSFWM